MVVGGLDVGMELPQWQHTEVNGGFFSNFRDFDIQTTAEEGRSILLTGEIQFGEIAPEILDRKTKTFIWMHRRLRGNETALMLDQATLNFGDFDNQRVLATWTSCRRSSNRLGTRSRIKMAMGKIRLAGS
jgi:hypothetical protein